MNYSYTHTHLLSGIVLAGIILSIGTFSVHAQTDLRPRPVQSTTDNRPDYQPEPARYDNSRHQETYRTTGFPERTTVSQTNTEPQSFLEKARNMLLQRREDLKNRNMIPTEVRDSTESGFRAGMASGTPELIRAQLATSTKERLEQIEERKSELRLQLEERRAELEEKKNERIARYLGYISRKMDAAIERLNTLADRILSRIEKLEEVGHEMTDARAVLDTARGEIAIAEEEMNSALEDAKTALEEDMTREAFGQVASTLAHAKESLRDAHKALVEVIRLLHDTLGETGEDDEREDDEGGEDDESDETPTTPGEEQ
ncbi:MAG: hypothetical protein OQJ98_00845 [Candidatus Pacebacteria bacterium]|nr:hypothetical protein [Candidatus Paceibacterota bacterium]